MHPRASNPASDGSPRGEAIGAGARLITTLVLIYRATIGQFLGGHCRFEPSCSQYMIDAVRKHGAAKGGWRGVKRMCRCRPGGGRGYDPA